MANIKTLKTLAEAARAGNAQYGDPDDWQPGFGLSVAEQAFAEVASPAAVLELIAEVEHARLVRFLHGEKATLHWKRLEADRDRLAAALERVRDRLKAAGATLPAPEPQGTIESALLQGLCIALVLVEQELPVLPAPPLTSRLREKLQAMQEQQRPAGDAGGSDRG